MVLALGVRGIEERLIVVIRRQIHKGINTIIAMTKTHAGAFAVECSHRFHIKEHVPHVS
jgi:hypothetical protein